MQQLVRKRNNKKNNSVTIYANEGTQQYNCMPEPTDNSWVVVNFISTMPKTISKPKVSMSEKNPNVGLGSLN